MTQGHVSRSWLKIRIQFLFHGVNIYSQHQLTRCLYLLRSSFISAHLFKVFNLLDAEESMNNYKIIIISPKYNPEKNIHSPAERV